MQDLLRSCGAAPITGRLRLGQRLLQRLGGATIAVLDIGELECLHGLEQGAPWSRVIHSGRLVSVQGTNVRDVLVRTDDHHAARFAIHASQLEDVPSLWVGAGRLLVVDEAERALLRNGTDGSSSTIR